jgi:hypothetical protein
MSTCGNGLAETVLRKKVSVSRAEDFRLSQSAQRKENPSEISANTVREEPCQLRDRPPGDSGIEENIGVVYTGVK